MNLRVNIVMSNPIDHTQILIDLTPYIEGNVTDEDIDNFVYSVYEYEAHPEVPEEKQRFDVFDKLLEVAARYHPYYSVLQENPRLREHLRDREPDNAGLVRWAAFHRPNTLKHLDESLCRAFGVHELREAGDALRAELKRQRATRTWADAFPHTFIHYD